MKKDKRTIKAKQEGLRARSAYKLEELNNKYHFLKDAKSILDLGSWPGGWSLIAKEFGQVTAIDRDHMPPIKDVTFIQADLFDKDLIDKLPQADVVLSDAAPNTAGDSRDNYKSYMLSMKALEIAVLKLKPQGSLVCKIFQGEDFDDYLKQVKQYFNFVKTTKPPSSKKGSKEIYLVAMYFKSQ